MQLTLTCTAEIATDLGFLLHKNPAALFEKEMTFGSIRVFYPEASAERCTATLQVEVDLIGLVRGRGATLAQYVSDRPYAASSFLSVAIAEAFGTALGGRSKERQERVDEKMPLRATLSALGCDGGEALIQRIFAPLGYRVTVERVSPFLDDRFPEWGPSDYYAVALEGEKTVRDLLTHLYVLVPVLDNAKHYFVGADEVDKLVKRGEGWLSAHPEKDLIASRYLRYRRTLTSEALARLADVEGVSEEDDTEPDVPRGDATEAKADSPVRLNDRRIAAVIAELKSADPPIRRPIDLGCGEGRTMAAILKEVRGLEFVAGMDVSSVALERAERRLHLDRMGETERSRVGLFQGSLVYRDARLAGFDAALLMEVNATGPVQKSTISGGFDAALLMEVLEHVNPDRLKDVERNLFEFFRPRLLVITTPNADYNTVWDNLSSGALRHPDHRFEWGREQFESWSAGICDRYNYSVSFTGIGAEDPDGRGTPTQMAVFRLSPSA